MGKNKSQGNGKRIEPRGPQAPPRSEPSHDEIAKRASELYQARVGEDGGCLDDWLAAEKELLSGSVK